MIVDVLISGGGMVGTALACALGAEGLRVAVVEARRPITYEVDSDYALRISALSPGSESLLRTLQAWHRIQQRRLCPYREMHVWDALGQGEIHFDCIEVGWSHLGHIIENHVVQDALIEQLQKIDTISWHCPESVQSFEVGAKHVDITLRSGMRFKARLLVGADGHGSRIRVLSGINYHAHSYQQDAIVTNVTTEYPHRYTAWQRFLPNGPIAFLPLESGQCSVVWSTTREQADELLAHSDDQFCEVLGHAIDFKLGQIQKSSRRASFPLRGAQAEPYVLPRVALIGDAAHSIHPLAGQGVNLGFKDAAILAEVLVDARRDIGSLRVLRKYERARKGDNVLIMRTMEGFKYLFGNKIPALTWLRNTGLMVTDRALPIKRQMMRYAMGIAGERPRLMRMSQ